MAANPLGAEIGKAMGFQISFGSWLLAASVPTLLALAVLPLLIYKVFPPEVKATPEAPAAARKALAAMGPLSLQEKIVAATFVVMVVLWGLAGTLKLDLTAVAFLGLGVLLATGVLTLKDIGQQGDVLATFIWFAILYTLSGQLNELGFMGYLGQRLGGALGGLPWSRGLRHPRRRLRPSPLPVRQPDGARSRSLRRVPRRRRAARRPRCRCSASPCSSRRATSRR